MPISGLRDAFGRLGVLPSYLSRLRLEVESRTLVQVSSLILILIVAIALRERPLRWGAYFTAYDPFFQYRVAEYIIQNGFSSWFGWHDTLSWYPMGRDVPHSSFPGLPFSAAALYLTLRALGLGVSLRDICLHFPVLMAAITCLIVYLLGRELGGGSVGLFASFFIAISPAFIGRTSLGFFDTENIGIFGMALLPLVFLRSIDRERPLRWRILYSAFAGLALAYLYASWGASKYITGLLTLFVISTLFTRLYDRRILTSYCLTMALGYLFALLVPKLGPRFLLSVENIVVLFLVLLLLAYETIRPRIALRRLLLPALLLTLSVVGVALLLQHLGLAKPLTGKFLSVLNPSKRPESPLLESVAEHKRAAWTSFFTDFGFTIPLSLFGSYAVLKGLNERRLYTLLFYLTALYFAGSMIRLTLILSVPLALMASYGLSELLTPHLTLASVRGRGRRRRLMGLGREASLLFVALLFTATLPTIWRAASTSYRPGTFACSAVPVVIGGRYPQDWIQALTWMRDNLPEDAVVVSWWDYGYWIETIAGRRTLADGSTRVQHQIAQIALIMMSNETISLEILKRYGATHIVVFNTFNPNNPRQQWPFGDNVKWSWMVQIAGLNISDYYRGRRYTAKFYDSTLYKLMIMTADPKHFELVFASEYHFVLVYKVKYPA
jgi:dolichyl-diphosphooligosaccharide--protein glycosyltransferase